MKQHGPRILLSLLFIVGGFGFLTNFAATTKFVGMGLGTIGLPMSLASIALVIAIILKLGGGLMLLFNYNTSRAAWMLIAFTIGATLMYHMNWGGENSQQMTAFLKNLAIIGGLMLYAKCPCKRCKAGSESCCSSQAETPKEA